MSNIKITIVDDHRIIRQGLKSLLIGCKDIKIIHSVGTGKELFEKLKLEVPDIIILDIDLPDMSGINILKKVIKNKINTKIIMFSAHSSEENIGEAILAGASGFLPKNTSREEFIDAVQRVYSGDVYFGKNISNIIYKNYVAGIKGEVQPFVELTEREIDVVKLICEGLLHKEVAEKLQISIRTVETHKKNVFDKLNINNSIDLVKYAIRNNIIKL